MTPILDPAFAGRLSDWVQVIRSEFGAMPDLKVTLAEATSRWPLETPRLEAVLDAFVSANFLERSSNGVYAVREGHLLYQ
jgi:hypothetical protein